MDEHSLLTVYEWIAERAEGLKVLVVGTGDGKGPARLAHRADLVFVYEQSRDVVADASYRYGHHSNLYFSTGGPFEAVREAVNFDVVVALESAVPKSWIRQLGDQARDSKRSQILITRNHTDIAQPDAFSFRSVMHVWGHRVTSVGSSPGDGVTSFTWGEPIADIVVASNHPIDERWEATFQTDAFEVEPARVQKIDEWRAAQELRKARAELDAVLNDRAIRLVLKWVAALRQIRRRIGRLGHAKTPPPSSLERVNRAMVEERIRALRPEPGLEDGPLVSIIILTRDGADVLSRLLRTLEDNTVYRSFEVVVVDNGSSDETGSLLDSAAWAYPIRVIRNTANQPFSEGCNAGAEVAEGELLLFLNNDVEPINEGWLGAMVASISSADSPRAVGALLIHPEIHPKLGVPFPVQHRGVEFRWRNGRPVGVHIGVGEDPTDPAFRFDEKVPALTGACLLVRREDFERVGGFTTGYVYGLEDVDLCLKLREAGVEMRLCGAAALFHKESTTQRRAAADIRNTKRLTNAHLFDERWKAPVSQWLLVDQLTGAGEWTIPQERKASVVASEDQVPGTMPAALAAGLRELGWLVETPPTNELRPDMDLTVVTTAEFDPDAFLELGGPTLAWPVAADPRLDKEWSARFHAIAAPGPRLAGVLEEEIGRSVPVLGPCVDTEHFHPQEPELALRCDYAIVAPASSRSSLVSELTVRPDERFLIFGPGWESVPEARAHHRGELELTALPRLYSSTDILIHSMVLDPDRSSSQILAAVACGALVVTDDEETSESVFGGALPVFRDAVELRQSLDRYLTDPEARRRLASQLRDRVLAHHTSYVIAREAIGLVTAAIDGHPG